MNDLVSLVPSPDDPVQRTVAHDFRALVREAVDVTPEILPVHIVELGIVADKHFDGAVVERLPLVRGRFVFVHEHGARPGFQND